MAIFIIAYMPISNASALENIFTEGDKFIELGISQGGSNVIDENKLKIEINNIYNILFAIGIALSVVVGAILGIKFMIGSVEEQAKIKETLIPYMLGCLVVFGAFGIWKIVITLGGKIL